MLSKVSNCFLLAVIIGSLVMPSNTEAPNSPLSNAAAKNAPVTVDAASAGDHNDTSRDREGEDIDTAPFKGNGPGWYEAQIQDMAAETNGTHGIPTEDFQRKVLNLNNQYRRQSCAGDLREDEQLHEIAHRIAHDKANNKTTALSDEYNEIVYSLDTHDPSKITPEIIVKYWFDKHQQYDSKNEKSAPEYSQLVWKSSTNIGVGHVYNGNTLYIYAIYKPAGNIQGQFAANVGCGVSGQPLAK